MADDVKALEARIAKLQGDASKEVVAAQAAVEASRVRLLAAVRAARDAKVPYRSLSEPTGKSVEYFRLLVHRSER
jgi:hypothetical protein